METNINIINDPNNTKITSVLSQYEKIIYIKTV